MKLLVDDDPHADIVPAHHVEEGGVALLEPAFSNFHLLRTARSFGFVSTSDPVVAT